MPEAKGCQLSPPFEFQLNLDPVITKTASRIARVHAYDISGTDNYERDRR